MILEMLAGAMFGGMFVKSFMDEYNKESKKDNSKKDNQPTKEERTAYWNLLKEYAKKYQYRKEDLTDDILNEIQVKTKRSIIEIKRDYAKAKEQIILETRNKTNAKSSNNLKPEVNKTKPQINKTTPKKNNRVTPIIVGVSPSIITLIITLFKDKTFVFDANDERIRSKLKRESAIGYWLQSSETDITYLEITHNDITFHKIFTENGLNQSFTVKEKENYQKVHYLIDFPKTTAECEKLVNKHLQYFLSDKMFQKLQLELNTKLNGKSMSFIDGQSFQEFVDEAKNTI